MLKYLYLKLKNILFHNCKNEKNVKMSIFTYCINSAFNATLLAASTSYTIKMEVKNGAGAVETKSITATTKAYRAPYIYNTQYLGRATSSSGYWRSYTKGYTGWAWVIKAIDYYSGSYEGCYALIIHANDRHNNTGSMWTSTSSSEGDYNSKYGNKGWHNSADTAFYFNGQDYYMTNLNSTVGTVSFSDGLSGIPTLTWSSGSNLSSVGQAFIKYILCY